MTLQELPTDVLWKAVRLKPGPVEFYKFDRISEGETLNTSTFDLDDVVLELARRIPEERRKVKLLREELSMTAL